MRQTITTIISDADLMVKIIIGCFWPFALILKPLIDKFTQNFFPTSKSIQEIREVQLREVYLPLYWKFRKYIRMSEKKLELSECRNLYRKAFVKVNKYPVYIEEDIIDCINKLGEDIKRHDADQAKEGYKKTAKKLLKNINIQYLALKKSLSYTTNTSFRSFRSLESVDQFYRVSSILYVLSAIGLGIGIILAHNDEPHYLVATISFLVLLVSSGIMLITVIFSIIDLVKLLFRRFIMRG